MRSINIRRLHTLLDQLKLPAPQRVGEVLRVPLLECSKSDLDYSIGVTNAISEAVDVVTFIVVLKKSNLRPYGWLEWELLMQ